MNDIRTEYKEKFGKRPGPSWTDEEIREKIDHEDQPQEETITMSKEKFREMMLEAQEEIKKEQKQYNRIAPSQWEEAKDEKSIKKAYFKVYYSEEFGRGIIIDLKRAPYDKFMAYRQNKDISPEKRDLYEVTVLFDSGQRKVIDMPLHDVALIHEKEMVDIIETKARKMIQKLGKIRRALVNKEGYTMSAGVEGGTDNVKLGEWVDEQVIRIEETHVIRRENGEVLEIENSKLNY